MQSPIDIKTGKIPVYPNTVNIKYDFKNEISMKVSKNSEEVVVNFQESKNSTSILTFDYHTINQSPQERKFKLDRLSFRFPAEHTINGNRLDGELLFEFAEIGPDKVYLKFI